MTEFFDKWTIEARSASGINLFMHTNGISFELVNSYLYEVHFKTDNLTGFRRAIRSYSTDPGTWVP